MRLVTKETAWPAFKKAWPKPADLEALDKNPLPDKLEIVSARPEQTVAIADAVRAMPDVAKVNDGRKNRDLYERLKDDIERGRQMYEGRVPPHVRDNTSYFVDELVRILAGGDASALGPM